ncbi:MAG: prepilin-type N-terminal cleavage/methylation domain-containing protein [Verrucomicrobiota bacterium]
MKIRELVRPAGFTLVEVLVAMGVGTTVLLVMMTVMSMGTQGYQEATRRIDAMVEARSALSVLADDVSTLVGTSDDEFGWEEDDERFHQIWFLTIKPEDAQDAENAIGDVCLVHYFTAVTPDAPIEDAVYSRKLYRRFWSSGEVIDRLFSGNLPSMSPNPELAEAIAFNVTRFVAQPLMSSPQNGRMIEWSAGNGTPESLGLNLQVIDSDTAALFREESDWDLTGDLARQLIDDDDERESQRGRDFRVNLSIRHED